MGYQNDHHTSLAPALPPQAFLAWARIAQELFCSKSPALEDVGVVSPGSFIVSQQVPWNRCPRLGGDGASPLGQRMNAPPATWCRGHHPVLGPVSQASALPLLLTARGASDAQRRSSQPSSPEDLKGNRIQKDQGVGLRSIRHRVQGEPEAPGLRPGGPRPLLWSSQQTALCVSGGLGNAGIFLMLSRGDLL